MHAKTRTLEAELLLYCTSVVYMDGQSRIGLHAKSQVNRL